MLLDYDARAADLQMELVIVPAVSDACDKVMVATDTL
jgi:hypothetical protein